VRTVLSENDSRWESLSQADRARLAAMARSIVGRLLHEPTLRLKQSVDGDDAHVQVQALRDLFALEQEAGLGERVPEPAADEAEGVTPLDARRAAARTRRSAGSSGR
jgi:glutamyl-tRNA reductase